MLAHWLIQLISHVSGLSDAQLKQIEKSLPPPRAATHPIQLRPQLARVTPRSMASASIRPPKPESMPARFNYPSLPGNPDSTQPKSALVPTFIKA
jgi:hypothetical protein